MKLTASNVHDIFVDCLFDDNDDKTNLVLVDGVMLNVGFNPIGLNKNKNNINDMLKCLPDSFMSKLGGGMSFLNMCNDKDDNQWADMHQTVDELLCLGKAIGVLSFLMPKEMWSFLPGGMPYIIIE